MEFLLIFLIFCIGVPAVLSVLNIIFIFKEEKFKSQTVNIIDGAIFVLGIPLTMFLIHFSEFKEWNVPVCFVNKFSEGGTYTPISFEASPLQTFQY